MANLTNVQKIKNFSEVALNEMRERLGAELDDEQDVKRADARINSMSQDELTKNYVAWHLGCGHWWDMFKSFHGALD